MEGKTLSVSTCTSVEYSRRGVRSCTEEYDLWRVSSSYLPVPFFWDREFSECKFYEVIDEK